MTQREEEAGGEEALRAPERQRYARHLQLPGFGVQGQLALRRSAVLCVGAGGLGAPALSYLAAAGVGRIGIIDSDQVELSNLQRQILFNETEIGQGKAVVASRKLQALNPEIIVDTYPERLSPENVIQLFKGYDLILDGSDNFATRYLVNDACVLAGLPYIYGAVSQFEGQVSLFNYRGGPTYRCLFGAPPPRALFPSCAASGVLGVLPGVVGSLMATEAVKLLCGIGENLSGILLLYDALSMSFQRLTLPPRCAPPPPGLAVEFHSSFELLAKAPAECSLTEDDFMKAAQVAGTLLLDVREPNEFEAGHLSGARNLPLSLLSTEPPPSWIEEAKQLLIYCQAGQRSQHALKILLRHQFSVVELSGGINALSAYHMLWEG